MGFRFGSVQDGVEHCQQVLRQDADRMRTLSDYVAGNQRQPYMPDQAHKEYKTLAERCVTNWCDLLVAVPLQALYVDDFRSVNGEAHESGAWRHWQGSGLDDRQVAVHRAALTYGLSYAVTGRDPDRGEVVTRPLSPRRTVALFEDPASDFDPVFAYTRVRERGAYGESDPGMDVAWDAEMCYEGYEDKSGRFHVSRSYRHGASRCPVTRFAANLDIDGRAWGVVEPLIRVQDRVNQTMFDLLMAQTYTAFVVRVATGMSPPWKMTTDPETGRQVPQLDKDGKPILDRVYLNASRFVYAENPDAKFSSLPGGDLNGFIAAADMAVRHLSALSQTPPHFFVGQIANVSAEALAAAESAMGRKVALFRSGFGESWERVFRVWGEITGEGVDEGAEVVWRDMSVTSLAQSADALGKFAQSLGIPVEGLWERVPGVTRAELNRWRGLLADSRDAVVYQGFADGGSEEAEVAWEENSTLRQQLTTGL